MTRLDQAVVLVVADGADDPETGDDDAAVVVGSTHMGCVLQEVGDQAVTAAEIEESVVGGRIVGGDDLRVRRDAFDEAGQDLAGPDLDEGRDAGRGHPLDCGDPIDAGGQVVDELGAGLLGGRDRAGVGVGEQRHRRIGERDAGERRRASPRRPRP